MNFIVIQYLQKFLQKYSILLKMGQFGIRAYRMLKVKQLEFKVPLKLLSQMKYMDSSDVIEAIFPSLNSSIIVVKNRRQNLDKTHYKTLIHILKDSKIAWEMDINVSGKLKVPNNHSIFYYSLKDSHFVYISLINYKLSTIKIEQSLKIKDYFFFSLTQMIAVVFQGQRQILIKYYDLEGFKKGNKCLQSIKIKLQFCQMFKYVFFQMNNRSKIGFVLQDLKNRMLNLHYFSYQYTPQKMSKQLTHQTQQLDPQLQQYLYNTFIIKKMEFPTHNQLFKAHYSTIIKKMKFPTHNQLFKAHHSIRFHSLVDDIMKRVIDQEFAEYQQGQQEYQQSSHQEQRGSSIAVNEIKEYHFHETAQFNFLYLAKYRGLPVKSQNIRTSKSNLQNKTFYAVEWDPNTLIYIDEKQLTIQNFVIIKAVTYQFDKDIYMDLLLHINEDFDDDLLQDAIQLIIHD